MKKVVWIILLGMIWHGASAQTEWKLLFNGKNLKGWKVRGGEAEFKVEDGAIVGVAKFGTPSTFLCTEQIYGDFILEFETFMESTLNSGVQFRSLSSPEYKEGRVHGYQCEIDPKERAWTGGIYDEARRGWLYSLQNNPEGRKAVKKGQWNKIRVEAIGSSIRTFVNGIPCADLLDDMTAEGFIGLQIHSIKNQDMDGSRVKWRNIRICTTDLEKNRTPENNVIQQINLVNNTISAREAAEGWKLLFDGKSMAGWVNPKTGKFPEQGYYVENGELIVNKIPNRRGGDIMTEKRYKNFAFRFDFFIAEGANNGIKYLYQTQVPEAGSSFKGLEYQILDNHTHPDANKGFIPRSRQLAALYDMLPPCETDKIFRGVNHWNTGMIVVDGNKVQHWLNGQLVLEYDRSSYVFNVLKSLSKFKDFEKYGQFEDGHILITDHQDMAKFRNLKIKEW